MKSISLSALSFVFLATTALGGILPIPGLVRDCDKLCTPTTVFHTLPAVTSTTTVTVPAITVTETVTVTTGPPQSTCIPPPVSLVNPGFEDGTGTNTEAPGWYVSGYRAGTYSVRTEEDAHSGRASAYAFGAWGARNDPWTTSMWQEQPITVCPGRTYRFEAFVRQKTLENCQVKFYVENELGGGASPGTARGTDGASSPGTTWEAMSRVFTIPEGWTSVYLLILGDCLHGTTANSWFVDDVSFTLVE